MLQTSEYLFLKEEPVSSDLTYFSFDASYLCEADDTSHPIKRDLGKLHFWGSRNRENPELVKLREPSKNKRAICI